MRFLLRLLFTIGTIGAADLTNIGLASEIASQYNIGIWARLFNATTLEEIKMLTCEPPQCITLEARELFDEPDTEED